MASFSGAHAATLLRYVGTSFVAGAVAHGSFSSGRSLLTASLGVVAYMAGSVMQEKLEKNKSQRWVVVILAGAVVAIGIGFFTGGLQHFPDSPERSVWVVPLGFLLSGLGLSFSGRLGVGSAEVRTKKDLVYLLCSFLAVMAMSAGAFSYFSEHHTAISDHHDDHHHDPSGSDHD